MSDSTPSTPSSTPEGGPSKKSPRASLYRQKSYNSIPSAPAGSSSAPSASSSFSSFASTSASHPVPGPHLLGIETLVQTPDGLQRVGDLPRQRQGQFTLYDAPNLGHRRRASLNRDSPEGVVLATRQKSQCYRHRPGDIRHLERDAPAPRRLEGRDALHQQGERLIGMVHEVRVVVSPTTSQRRHRQQPPKRRHCFPDERVILASLLGRDPYQARPTRLYMRGHSLDQLLLSIASRAGALLARPYRPSW